MVQSICTCLNSFRTFLTTSNRVFLGLPLGLAPSTSIYMHFLTQTSLPFLSTWPNHLNLVLFRTLSAASVSILSLSSQSGTTHLPNHSPLCPLQHQFMPLLHWLCPTSIHHAASDTVPIDLTFQFEWRSFESQDGRQLFELLPSLSYSHKHCQVCSTICI